MEGKRTDNNYSTRSDFFVFLNTFPQIANTSPSLLKHDNYFWIFKYLNRVEILFV